MSDQESQPEPSMEEILASIRRIISEDGDEDAPAVEATAPAPEAEGAPVPEQAVDPVQETEEDVLELTDEVQDDGTVVNLKTGKAVNDDDGAEEREEEIELEMIDAVEEAADEPETEFAAGSDSEFVPEPEQDIEFEPQEILIAAAADRLVSDNPAMNSVTSLSALAAAVDGHRRAVDPSIGPKTIEDLVKEVMRPMIREWLDDNLPSLVERMVGREIERLTREAEEISQQ